MNYILLPIFLFMSALMSGLTLAILGLDTFDLKRKSKLGDSKAARVLPIRIKGNWALCTFLITNAGVNSTISMLLTDSIGTGLIAVAVATVSIFIFGEVIPQAICNKYKIEIASATAPFVRLLMYVTAPLTYPMSLLLDKLLGEELPNRFTQKELHEIIKETPDHYLDQDEKKILAGGLTFSQISAIKVMTPVNQVYALELNAEISIQEIKTETYSRIPIYEGTRDYIVGILYAKDLIGVNEKFIKVREHYVENNLIKINEKTLLDDLLNKMTMKKSHMSFIFDEFGVWRGIVTLEDIVETIINREIIDEHDQIPDLQAYAKKEFNLERTLETAEEMQLSGEELPWATYGKGHDMPLNWVKLSQCSTEHLQAILDTQPVIKETRYEDEINRIIAVRKTKNLDHFSEKNGYTTPAGKENIEELMNGK